MEVHPPLPVARLSGPPPSAQPYRPRPAAVASPPPPPAGLAPPGPLSAQLSPARPVDDLPGFGLLRAPLFGQMRVSLPPERNSPGAARNLVADACLSWHLPSMLHPARAVASELVANAVEHAASELEVTLSLRGPSLHLAIRDGSPELPRTLALAPPVAGQPLDERGRGLRVVEADTIAWGAMRIEAGKIVWAIIRPRDCHSRTW